MRGEPRIQLIMRFCYQPEDQLALPLEIVPFLVEAIRVAETPGKTYAMIALINGVGPEAVPALIDGMQGADSDVWLAVLDHLASWGRKARVFAPVAQSALANRDEAVRKAAATTLKKIDPDAATKAGVW
jgi:hypothetical protein